MSFRLVLCRSLELAIGHGSSILEVLHVNHVGVAGTLFSLSMTAYRGEHTRNEIPPLDR